MKARPNVVRPFHASTLLVLLAAPAAAGRGERMPLATQVRATFPDEMIESGIVGQTALGDLNGDLRLDAAQIAGSDVWVTSAPSVLQAHVELDGLQGAAHALTIVRGASRHGSDLLVTADDGGVRAWELDRAGERFESQSDVVAPAGEWASITLLESGDVDGDGYDDVVAYSTGGGGKVIVWVNDQHGRFTELDSFKPDVPVSALRIVRWGHVESGAAQYAELALVSAQMLQIVALEPTPVAVETFTAASDSVALTVLPSDASTADEVRDSIAWVTKVASASDEELHLLSPATTSPPPLALGALRTAGICAGDFDRDGDQDLAITLRSSPTLVRISNQRELGPSFQGGMPYALDGACTLSIAPTGTSMAQQSARPCTGDLDGDGDVDIYTAVQGAGGFVVQRDYANDESRWEFASFGAGSVAGDDAAELVLGLPSCAENEVHVYGLATHVELSVFARASVAEEFALEPVVETSMAIDEFEAHGPIVLPVGYTLYGPVGENLTQVILRYVRVEHDALHDVDVIVRAWPDTTLDVARPGYGGLVGGVTPLPSIGRCGHGGLPPPPPNSRQSLGL